MPFSVRALRILKLNRVHCPSVHFLSLYFELSFSNSAKQIWRKSRHTYITIHLRVYGRDGYNTNEFLQTGRFRRLKTADLKVVSRSTDRNGCTAAVLTGRWSDSDQGGGLPDEVLGAARPHPRLYACVRACATHRLPVYWRHPWPDHGLLHNSNGHGQTRLMPVVVRPGPPASTCIIRPPRKRRTALLRR